MKISRRQPPPYGLEVWSKPASARTMYIEMSARLGPDSSLDILINTQRPGGGRIVLGHAFLYQVACFHNFVTFLFNKLETLIGQQLKKRHIFPLNNHIQRKGIMTTGSTMSVPKDYPVPVHK